METQELNLLIVKARRQKELNKLMFDDQKLVRELNKDLDKQIKLVDNISALTHAHKVSKASCNIYNFIVQEVLNNHEEDFKTLIEIGIDKSRPYYENSEYKCFETIYNDLFSVNDDYMSGRGYVVDSLEVALYSCYHTDDYESAVLKAVNYGGDTDTNAMIAGGLSGLYYGFGSIPQDWLNTIIKLDYINFIFLNHLFNYAINLHYP